jgi:acetyl-CoA carboxylase biotin carboxylase subunit
MLGHWGEEWEHEDHNEVLLFRKILIANRGEIAVRVIRACRELGIRSVAVYSDADRRALHVRYADEAFRVGPAPSVESYLRIDRIVDAARRSGAEAVHPGYGFLAENPDFARACEDAGLVFIGPSPAAMELLGSKTAARQLVMSAGLPVVPGTERSVESLEELRAVASRIGFPLMLKASAGGGGKGMRLVHNPAELESAYRNARSEAQNAFGDPAVYAERYIERPRHIEVQILGDLHGNIVYLGERECSLQRRHQKVVEECPSPIVDEGLRRRLGETAVRIGQLAGYWNAGTVEFLVGQDRQFYFLEVNARLQVEHPVTEMVFGVDLVKAQLRIAAGEPLPWRQEELGMRGAAIECRICAEDPANNFFPCPGLITGLKVPSGGGVRDDSGVFEGWTVPLEYDPLLSKLIVWGTDRAEAIARMRRALEEYSVAGIETNLGFLRCLLAHPDFAAGELHTGTIERLLEAGLLSLPGPEPTSEAEKARTVALLAAALHAAQGQRRGLDVDASRDGAGPARMSPWKAAGRREALRRWPQPARPS